MDVETLLLVVAGVVGTIAAGAHMLGYVPPRYKRVLRDIQASTASGIGKEVERALNAALDRQRSLAAADMQAAIQAQTDAVKGAETSIKMSGVRALGVDKAQMRELNEMAVEGILGPVLSAIEMWNPAWAERLRTMDPQLLLRFIDSPFFQQQILPRIKPITDRFVGTVSKPGPTAIPKELEL